MPLDGYGNKVVLRLAHIETLLNALVPAIKLEHYTELAKDREDGHGLFGPVFLAWSRFLEDPSLETAGRAWGRTRSQPRRARFAIVAAFLVIHVAFAIQAREYYRSGWQFLATQPSAAATVEAGTLAPAETVEPAATAAPATAETATQDGTP